MTRSPLSPTPRWKRALDKINQKIKSYRTFQFILIMWFVFIAEAALFLISPSLLTDVFILTPENPLYVWTWITSIFAHGSPMHLLVNSIALASLGPATERLIGKNRFTYIFVAAGVFSGLAQILPSALFGTPSVGVIGASGAILMCIGVLSVYKPDVKVLLFFVLPISLWIVVPLILSLSAGAIAVGGVGYLNIAHIAHMAGVLFGFLYGFIISDRIGVSPDFEEGFGPSETESKKL